MIVRYDFVARSIFGENHDTHIMGFCLLDNVEHVKEVTHTFKEGSELVKLREDTCNATNYEWVSFDHDLAVLSSGAKNDMGEPSLEEIEVRVVRLSIKGDPCDKVLVTSHGGYIMSDQGKTIQKF